MSRASEQPDLERPHFEPFIALADKCARALRNDMLTSAHARGFTELAGAHDAVFATLPPEGARAADMATRAGITRQSMGEVVRDMARLGIVEMVPDPSDRRAKIVRYTDYGRKVAQGGFDHILEVEDMLREEFGEEDLATTRRVLARVRELLAGSPAPD
ncbi:DNA-binding MarR family transcriptional regulator [Nocardioides aromaticivorans]|uniref:DNA-binding MarR family transcriptional regulator n=1 Tax=Nocardioides aromaticivorans TaxID=200618 RepID=A0A7Y9ZJL0_9ACTN|nr:MarR family winged helix-turn-helix transcriptional regulator [Nocardioides aromaticivorans]NYI45548.1 DNA-binding MarR family transcriptional regulator [Nocardioides aromaticivorans]